MIYYTLLDPTDFISNPVNYLLYAAARYGTNGDFYPAPEMGCGGPGQEDEASMRRTWDPDLSDGFDSGYVSMSLDADLGDGIATWGVNGDLDGPVTYSFAPGDTVASVRITAGTQVPGTAEWSDLTITFYDQDVQQDSITIADGPSVDTTQSTGGVGEQILVVTPDSTLYDRVSVSGTFRMTHAPDVYPAPSDLFGQIYIIPQTT